MRVSEADPASMVLFTRRDGSAGTGEERTCGLCGAYLTEVVVSPGLRRRAPTLPDRTSLCINTRWLGKTPCPMAIRAKPLLDAILGVS